MARQGALFLRVVGGFAANYAQKKAIYGEGCIFPTPLACIPQRTKKRGLVSTHPDRYSLVVEHQLITPGRGSNTPHNRLQACEISSLFP